MLFNTETESERWLCSSYCLLLFWWARAIFSTPISNGISNCNSVLEESELSYGLCWHINVLDTHIFTDRQISKETFKNKERNYLKTFEVVCLSFMLPFSFPGISNVSDWNQNLIHAKHVPYQWAIFLPF